MGPLALFCVLICVAAAEGSEETRTFQHGTKLNTIIAREQGRLNDRINTVCEDNFKYRPINGVCNNLKNPTWGTPLQTLRRLTPPHYNGDGSGSIPRFRSRTNQILPSARKVSVECFKSDSSIAPEESLSRMVMQFGQFTDHDITMTAIFELVGCCDQMNSDGSHPDFEKADGLCYPILIEANDRQFSSNCMEFSRSTATTQPTENNRREQMNVLTAYVDGSNVYGGSQEELAVLRDGSTAFLKTSGDNMLPTSDKTFCVKRGSHSCYEAGDFRANDIPGLTLLHTLWVRQHNRLATELKNINSNWDDETVFQEARKIVIASIQHIMYNAYLPRLLGSTIYNHFGLSDTFEYDDNVNPGIFNSFAAAAFRQGHSTIAGSYRVKNDPQKNIAELFMDTSYVTEGFNDVLRGIIEDANPKTDDRFTRGITDHLFEDTMTPGSLDLTALNIQRSRDHGLAPYSTYYNLTYENLKHANIFTYDLKMPECGSGLYEDLDEVDLYPGAMSESPLSGGLLGPTFSYIIGQQFQNFRNGDRFWYETTNTTIGFTPENDRKERCPQQTSVCPSTPMTSRSERGSMSTNQLAEIKKITMARIICDNTEPGFTQIQPDVFRLPTASGNSRVSCESIPKIDLQKWKE